MLNDDIGLAAEYALGLLEGEELDATRARLLDDRAFAAEVARWQSWLATLLATYPEMAPPERLEERVVAGIAPVAANDVGPAVPPRRWRWVGMGALAAAVLAFAMVLGPVRSPPPIPAPVQTVPAQTVAHPLLAALAVQDGQGAPGRSALAAAVNRRTGEIRVAGTTAVPDRRTAQLWAIGKNGTPVPLGLLAAAGPTRLTVPAGARALLSEGTTLAVSIEPVGGSPTGLPTGPVVAAGALALS